MSFLEISQIRILGEIKKKIPVTENYIEREYTIKNNHLMLYNESEIILIEKKAKKVREMIKHGVKFTRTQPDVMKIFEKLVSLDKK